MNPIAKSTARRIGTWFVGLALCAVGVQSASADPPRGSENKHYTFFYLGGFDTSETAAVLDDSKGGGAFGGGWGWRFHRFLTFEFDANVSSTDYELPEAMTRSDLDDASLTLSTLGVLGNLKFGRQLGRLRPHAGVGLGAGVVDVSLSDPGFWLVEPLESQFSLLTQVLAGIDIRVSRRSHLGLEYRELIALRTITFGGEKIDGGGESFILAYRFGL